MRRRWAVLISGRGSTCEAFARALVEETAADRLVAVFSDRAAAKGLPRARRLGLHVEVMPALETRPGVTRPDSNWLINRLQGLMITDVFLLGHMRILQEAVLASGPRFFNLHPSLLPSFPGLKSLERAFAAQAPLGCTIHKVVPEVDAGQALLQLPLGAGGRAYLETDLQMAALALHAAESRALRRFCRRPRGAD